MRNSKIQIISKCAIMSALAAVIMQFSIVLPFVPPFYELDLSEVIIMLVGFALGPLAAIICEALKIILNLIIDGTATLGIGELANFIMGCSFIIPAVMFYHKHKSRANAAKGMILGTISLSIVACLLNYFVLLPVYAFFFQMDISALVAMGSEVNGNITDLFGLVVLAVLPFNLLKGGLNAIIVYFTYKKVSPILKR